MRDARNASRESEYDLSRLVYSYFLLETFAPHLLEVNTRVFQISRGRGRGRVGEKHISLACHTEPVGVDDRHMEMVPGLSS